MRILFYTLMVAGLSLIGSGYLWAGIAVLFVAASMIAIALFHRTSDRPPQEPE